jgi:hypothetical protein
LAGASSELSSSESAFFTGFFGAALALVFLFNNFGSSSLESSATCGFFTGALAFPLVGAVVFPFFTSTSESFKLDNSSSTFLAGALV